MTIKKVCVPWFAVMAKYVSSPGVLTCSYLQQNITLSYNSSIFQGYISRDWKGIPGTRRDMASPIALVEGIFVVISIPTSVSNPGVSACLGPANLRTYLYFGRRYLSIAHHHHISFSHFQVEVAVRTMIKISQASIRRRSWRLLFNVCHAYMTLIRGCKG